MHGSLRSHLVQFFQPCGKLFGPFHFFFGQRAAFYIGTVINIRPFTTIVERFRPQSQNASDGLNRLYVLCIFQHCFERIRSSVSKRRIVFCNIRLERFGVIAVYIISHPAVNFELGQNLGALDIGITITKKDSRILPIGPCQFFGHAVLFWGIPLKIEVIIDFRTTDPVRSESKSIFYGLFIAVTDKSSRQASMEERIYRVVISRSNRILDIIHALSVFCFAICGPCRGSIFCRLHHTAESLPNRGIQSIIDRLPSGRKHIAHAYRLCDLFILIVLVLFPCLGRCFFFPGFERITNCGGNGFCYRLPDRLRFWLWFHERRKVIRVNRTGICPLGVKSPA